MSCGAYAIYGHSSSYVHIDHLSHGAYDGSYDHGYDDHQDYHASFYDVYSFRKITIEPVLMPLVKLHISSG